MISIINGVKNGYILNLSAFNLSCKWKLQHTKATHYLSGERLYQLVGCLVFYSSWNWASPSDCYSSTGSDLPAVSTGFLPKWLLVRRGSRSGPLEHGPPPPLSILPIIRSDLGDQPARQLTAVRGHLQLSQVDAQGLCKARTRSSKTLFLARLWVPPLTLWNRISPCPSPILLHVSTLLLR